MNMCDCGNDLLVGQVEDNYGIKQYLGEVANLNIFTGIKHVENLLERSCEHTGDIVNEETKWKRVGDVKERSEDSTKICNNDKVYSVAIPAKMK